VVQCSSLVSEFALSQAPEVFGCCLFSCSGCYTRAQLEELAVLAAPEDAEEDEVIPITKSSACG
jgi:hypothetical protein